MKKSLDRAALSRRSMIQFGAGLVGASSLTAWLGTGALAHAIERQSSSPEGDQRLAGSPGSSHPQSALTSDQALAKLIEGNQRFVQSRRINPHQDVARLTEVAAGQAPFAAILSCADSRVVPEIVFDQGMGDLFVVRGAGNLALTEDIASQEYAVGVLNVPLLVVLGHERCGAVAAALEGGELPGVIESLVFAIRPAVQASEQESGDRLTNAIKANVRLQVQRLQTSSVIASAVQAGKLNVVGAYYDLDTGEVSLVS